MLNANQVIGRQTNLIKKDFVERVITGHVDQWPDGHSGRDTGNLDALRRDALVRCWSHGEILRLLRERLISAALAGREPGAEASVRKALADDHGQEVMGLAKDLAGTAGMIAGRGPGGVVGEAGAMWSHGFLYSQALTIGGGTSVVQRNIIAERVLGLPKELTN